MDLLKLKRTSFGWEIKEEDVLDHSVLHLEFILDITRNH